VLRLAFRLAPEIGPPRSCQAAASPARASLLVDPADYA